MFRRTVALGLLVTLLGAAPALAHPRFVTSSPRRAGVATTALREIRVSFSEPVLAKGSTFQLLDPRGVPVRTGRLVNPPKDPMSLVLPIAAPLRPGGYTVKWTVLAAGHSAVPGLYRFRVKP